ncbi:glycerophosphodiester phosphodiesterase family protein [Oceanobacillus sp. FSL K6-2867]|uniref:glycerophosphodiester phosphodiesterase family protein n=1 Tax=Oceanobacillus sp. FSL K6-2867 TaxID=2954748 RepID=UPI0030DAEFBD
MCETKIYGHRGCMGSFPENTLLGFKKAIELGVDGLEIDVHMTEDGEIVVIHDETLDRTTDGSGFIKDLTLEEIKQYSAGVKHTHFHDYDEVDWTMERVPTLKELLELLEPYPIDLNIELKTYRFPYEGIEEKILSLVEQYGNGRKVVYSTFHLPTLLRIKSHDKEANIAWLLEQPITHPLDYMNTLDLEALHISKRMLLSDPFEWKGMFDKLRVWTVNEKDELKQLLDLRVNAIITDFPEKALFYRSERLAFS